MADLNLCTSRKLSSKAGISSELACEIVDLRKQKGRIQSFSELLDAKGMTRSMMKQLTSNFVIRDAPPLEVANVSNNNKRTFGKSKAPKNPGIRYIKPKSVANKQSIEKLNSRFLESLPLLADTDIAETNHDTSLMTLYTPMAVQSTPSGEKIFTVYKVASPNKIQTMKDESKAQPSADRSDNYPEFSTRVNPPSRAKFSVIARSRRSRLEQNLSPTKKRSIQKWLQNSSTRSVLSKSDTSSRSRIRVRNKDRTHSSSRQISLSRSRSKTPLLRKMVKYENNQASVSKSKQHKDKARARRPVQEKSKLSRFEKKSLIKPKNGKQETFYNRLQSSGKRTSADAPLSLQDIEASTEGKKNGLPFSRSRKQQKTTSRCRSRSVESADSLTKETVSVSKHKVEITRSSRDSDNESLTRRSLRKDTQRRHHRTLRGHHHRHRRSRDKLKSHDIRNAQNSKNANESCVIL